MKYDKKGFIMLDSLLGFLVIVLSIELLGAYVTVQNKINHYETEDFEEFQKLNSIFYEEGADLRYEEMIERVQSY